MHKKAAGVAIRLSIVLRLLTEKPGQFSNGDDISSCDDRQSRELFYNLSEAIA